MKRLVALAIVVASAAVVVASFAERSGATASAGEAASAEAAMGAPPPLPSGAATPAAAEQDDPFGGGCTFPDRGYGSYEAARELPLRVAREAAVRPRAKIFVRPRGALDDDGAFDVLVHFHGADPVRKELAVRDLPLVLVTIDAGSMSSHYDALLADDAAVTDLFASIDSQVALATGRLDAHARHVIVSSWSAGYGAVAKVVRAAQGPLAAVVLLDSLHASYEPGKARIAKGQLPAFASLVREAAKSPFLGARKEPSSPIFFLTHSEVATSGYASTTETAAFLLSAIGAREIALPDQREEALAPSRIYDEGRLFVRGYPGGAREDHCAQLRLLPSILEDYVLPALGR